MMLNYFGIQFPESMYPPSNIDEYKRLVNIGFSFIRFNNPSFLVAGLARDCMKECKLNVDRWNGLGIRHTFHIIENDSVDGTDTFIGNRALGECLKIGTPRMTGKGLLRRAAMSTLRNKYVPNIPTYDFVIVYDFDIKGGFSYEGFYHSIGLMIEDKNIGAVTANGLLYSKNDDGTKSKVYYDCWTYRPLEDGTDENYNLLNLKRGDSPYEVQSAFGGMGIYRGDIFHKGVIEYNDKDCEHVNVNKCIRDKGLGIIVNPSLIVLYNGHYYTA